MDIAHATAQLRLLAEGELTNEGIYITIVRPDHFGP